MNEIELLRAEMAVLSGNLGVNTTGSQYTGLVMEETNTNTDLENQGNYQPKKTNFFSKYFYTLFSIFVLSINQYHQNNMLSLQ